jgi:Zn-finger nucleic acid-binding protein
MRCPVCNDSDLLTTERQGVEIDSCPSCRGVWLDRGELDAIVARSAGGHDRDESDHDDHRHGGSGSKKKKSSLFGDILGGLGG